MKGLTISFPDVDEWAAALKGEEEVQKFCQAERTGLLTADPEALTKSLLATLLPEVDKKAVLEDENTGNDIVTSIKEALRVSCDGWVDDDLAFLQPCKHQPSLPLRNPVFHVLEFSRMQHFQTRSRCSHILGGFDLSEIKVPVFLYQGSEDLMVPLAHGQWQADHLPKDKVKARLLEGEGHISIVSGYLEEMLDNLLAVARE